MAEFSGYAFPSDDDAMTCGMTLRDWFAGQIAAVIMREVGVDCDKGETAELAYDMAEALVDEKLTREAKENAKAKG